MEELEALADIVINNVYVGLKTPMNFSLSVEQVQEELVQRRNATLRKRAEAGLVFTHDLYTVLNCKTLAKKDIRGCCDLPANCDYKVLNTQIPALLMINQVKSVVYAGEISGFKPFKVIVGPNIYGHLKSKYTGHLPTVWIDSTYQVWVFNAEIEKLKLIVLLDDFRGISEFNCECENYTIPIPKWLSADLTRQLTMDYITYYQRAQPQPNTQSEILTPTK